MRQVATFHCTLEHAHDFVLGADIRHSLRSVLLHPWQATFLDRVNTGLWSLNTLVSLVGAAPLLAAVLEEKKAFMIFKCGRDVIYANVMARGDKHVKIAKSLLFGDTKEKSVY